MTPSFTRKPRAHQCKKYSGKHHHFPANDGSRQSPYSRPRTAPYASKFSHKANKQVHQAIEYTVTPVASMVMCDPNVQSWVATSARLQVTSRYIRLLFLIIDNVHSVSKN
ncbi:hypothetical protein MN608_03559 [Microdochium nivale]|nr:hypothetical protein MN608_03559 [Microdochium nivale]